MEAIPELVRTIGILLRVLRVLRATRLIFLWALPERLHKTRGLDIRYGSADNRRVPAFPNRKKWPI